MPPGAGGTWLFGRYRLELARRRLHSDGYGRDLDARSCAVLVCLLRRAGDVVPRAALIAEAWPGIDPVFDSAVSKVMRRLRTALGDPTGQVLQTIYGEGYRLALPATFLPAAPGTPERSRRTPAHAAEGSPGTTASGDPAGAPRDATEGRGAAATGGRAWIAWLPWAIAAASTLVALWLGWQLLRAGSAG